jgi:predicted SprT family Zn-dependent metalloprotease
LDLSAAQSLANEMLQQHGLSRQWRFVFDRAVRRFGNCNYRRKTISLSAKLTQLNDEAIVRDTILHEIAHALAPRNAGHGEKWKTIARSIGCNAQRCYGDDVVTPKQKYIGKCPNCATTIRRNRKKRLSCARCDRKYNPAHLFVWQVS